VKVIEIKQILAAYLIRQRHDPSTGHPTNDLLPAHDSRTDLPTLGPSSTARQSGEARRRSL
jgi:hypothetical protein